MKTIKLYQEEPILCKSEEDFLNIKKTYSHKQKIIVICPDCGTEKLTNKRCTNFRCKKCLERYRHSFWTEESSRKMVEKRLETINNWTAEEKESFSKNVSNAMKGKSHYSSPEAIKKAALKNKEIWANKTKEEIKARTQKRQNTINIWTNEEKERHHQNYKDTQKRIADKKSKSLKEHYAKMTREERHSLFKKLRAKKYMYDNEVFDSAYELCFYIMHKEQGDSIEREPCSFEYTYNNEKHLCFPDFKLNNCLIEIKGEHFLENDKWINPYCREQDGLFEEKRKCLIKNNVTILYYNDIKNCIEYVASKYGDNYKDFFRREK